MTRVFAPNNMKSLATWVNETGEHVKSERGDTIEVMNASLVVRNPLNRLDTTKSRKLNVAFAFAEWLSMMTNTTNISYFTNFIKGYGRFSTDGKWLDGAYGARIDEQLPAVVSLLRSKPETRRAVIAIYDRKDVLGFGGLNTPCTLSFHFLVRSKKLQLITTMRSNDLVLGLANDVVVNTLLLEWMSLATGIPMGEYYHNASSLHLYSEDVVKATSASEDEGRWPHLMHAMDPSMKERDELEHLAIIYGNLLPFEDAVKYCSELHSQYALDMAMVGLSFLNRSNPNGMVAYKQISDITLRRLALAWITK